MAQPVLDSIDEAAEPRFPRRRPWWRAPLAAVGWAVGGALAAGAAWWAAVVVARGLLRESVPPAGPVGETAMLMAGIGGGWGLLVGGLAGLVRGRGLAAAVMGAVGGLMVGLIGGGLGPPAVAAAGGAVPAAVASALPWAFAGLLAGLVAYGWSRGPGAAADDLPEAEAVEERPAGGWGFRAAVLGIAALALAAAAFGVASAWLAPGGGSGWLAVAALVAVAAQGVAVAAALGRQARHIRELRQQLREWEGRD